jgi:cell division protein FtsL
MMARPVRIALFALLGVAILFLFVFPTRSYMAQRGEVQDAREDVEAIQEQIVRLQEEAARLKTPAEIERLARQQFNMVYPGERPYQVVEGSDEGDAP